MRRVLTGRVLTGDTRLVRAELLEEGHLVIKIETKSTYAARGRLVMRVETRSTNTDTKRQCGFLQWPPVQSQWLCCCSLIKERHRPPNP